MCSSTGEGTLGTRASMGARDARRDVEKVQRNAGGGGWKRNSEGANSTVFVLGGSVWGRMSPRTQ